MVGVPYVMPSGFLKLDTVDIWVGPLWVCPMYWRMFNSILQQMLAALPHLPSCDHLKCHMTLSVYPLGQNWPQLRT